MAGKDKPERKKKPKKKGDLKSLFLQSQLSQVGTGGHGKRKGVGTIGSRKKNKTLQGGEAGAAEDAQELGDFFDKDEEEGATGAKKGRPRKVDFEVCVVLITARIVAC